MKKRGTVTILVVISLIPLLVVSLFTVDIARISYAKNILSQGNELVLNSQLTRFNKALKDTYGLFAANNNFDENEFKKEYAKILINVTNGQLDSSVADQLAQSVINTPNAVQYTGSSNSLGIQVQSLDIRKANNGDLRNTDILQDQILEHMKYRGPISIGYGFLNKLSSFKSIEKEKDVAQKKIAFEKSRNDVLEKIKDLYDGLEEFYEAQKLFKSIQRDEVARAQSYFNSYLPRKLIRTSNMNYKDFVLTMREYAFDTKERFTPLEISQDVKNKFENAVKEGKVEEILKNLASGYDSGHFDHGDCILTQKEIDSNLLYINADGQKDEFYTSFHNFYRRADYQCQKVKDFFGYLELYRRKYGGSSYQYEMGGKKHSIPLTYFSEINNRVNIYINGIENQFKRILTEYVKNKMDDLRLIKAYYDKLASQEEGINEKLNQVVNAIKTVNEARENWSNEAKQLDAGEVKDKALQEIKTSLQEFNQKDFDELKKTINDEISNVESYDDTLQSIKLIHNGTSISELDLYEDSSSDSIYTGLITLMSEYNKKNLISFSGIEIKGEPLEDIKSTKLINELKFYKFTEKISKNFKDNSDKVDENSKEYEEKKNSVKDQLDNAFTMVGAIKLPNNSNGGFSTSTDGIQNTDRKNAISTLESAFNSLGKIIKGLAGFGDGNILKDSAEAILLNEYSTEFFTDYLDANKNESCSLRREYLLNGKEINRNSSNFGAEVEYILYGHLAKDDNIEQAKNEILLMRFGLNVIYSFTDSEITNLTTSMSTVAGPFAPLLKIALHIVISLAESYFDLYLMIDKCLPVSIYKTARTWVFKPTGALNVLESEAKEWATKAAEGVIQGVFSALNDKAVDTVDKLEKSVNDGVRSFIDDKVDTVLNQIKSEVQDPVFSILESMDHYMGEEESKNHIDKVFSEIKQHIESTEDEYKPEKLMLFNSLEKQVKPLLYQMTKKISEAKEGFDTTVNEYFNQINDIVKKASKDIVDIIQEKVSSGFTSLKQKINAELAKAEEKTIEYTKQQIAKAFAEETTDKVKTNSTQKGKGVGIEFNYREYLKLFMLLRHMDKENARPQTLNKISKLIEANIQEQDQDFSFEKYGSVYTITTKIKINTLLLGNENIFSKMFVKQENQHYKINPVKFGNQLEIDISSILGY